LVEIWDYDIGMEFTDDLLARVLVRVPFCSTFTANYETIDCGQPFGCQSEDSLWASPRRQICNDTAWINFDARDPFNGANCVLGTAKCLLINTIMVPFTMAVELQYPNGLTRTPQLGCLGRSDNRAPWTMPPSFSKLGQSFGYAYLESSTRV